jgi:hypothetical protein
MIQDAQFPNLTTTNHRITSDPTPEYNCIAWAAGDTEHWWQPGVYWPASVEGEGYGIATLVQLFQSLNFVDCQKRSDFESGFEKVALYGAGIFYTHAAKQAASGKWSSKLGRDVDIEHDTPEDVAGGVYGEVLAIMKRPIETRHEPH